jgi:phosphotransferase system HPr (HPr) family protein
VRGQGFDDAVHGRGRKVETAGELSDAKSRRRGGDSGRRCSCYRRGGRAEAALTGKQSHPAPASSPTAAPILGSDSVSGTFVVTNAHGLHARPAARLVAQVRTLDASVQLTNLTTGTGPVPASGLSRVATLGARHGHEVEVSITGSQAPEALAQILALAKRHFDERDSSEPARPVRTSGPLPASPGIAIGPALLNPSKLLGGSFR